ncbi:MAG: serine/threonine protein kinase [Polyangiaceae bacterium]
MNACSHAWGGLATLGGQCPACLLSAALDDGVQDHERPVPEFPHYAAFRFIAEGGTGEVWEAFDTRLGRLVALKVLRSSAVDAAAVGRFLDGARAAANLKHAHIVAVHEVGQHAGLHYFSMDLVTGGTLADEIEHFRADRRCAVEALVTLADALQFAHDHGVLHRDLKPANILLDEDRRPYLTDFGLALHVDRVGVTLQGVVAGTPQYMAPEQAEGRTRDLTVATDVYGLGVILYHLLTGRPPFLGATNQSVLEQVKRDAPVSPRRLDPMIERDLALLCLRCLEKEPAHRYRSAGELASTLRQFLAGQPIGRVGAVERALRFYRRNPFLTALLGTLLSFVLILTPSALSLAHGEEAQKRADIVADNQNGAQMFAYAVLGHLRALSDAVARSAAEPSLAAALESRDGARLQNFCEAKLKQYDDPTEGLKLAQSSPFDMWFLADAKGVVLADSRMPMTDRARLGLSPDYAWRDYFRGAQALAARGLASTYVSPAFKSEPDHLYKFAISTPVYSSDGKRTWLGVLVAAVASQANLGSLILKDTRSAAVLVAPRGQERTDAPPELPFLILRHPAYSEYGHAVEMDGPEFRLLAQKSEQASLRVERWGLPRRDLASNEDYRDPAAARFPAYAGSWLAGFAPVGNTGFVVVVQTRESDALKPIKHFGAELAKWIGIALSPGLVLVAFATLRARKRR